MININIFDFVNNSELAYLFVLIASILFILAFLIFKWDIVMSLFESYLKFFWGIAKFKLSSRSLKNAISEDKVFLEIKIPKTSQRTTFQVQQKLFRSMHSIVEDSYRFKTGFVKIKIFNLIQKWVSRVFQNLAQKRLLTLQIFATHSYSAFGVWVPLKASVDIKNALQSAYPECEVFDYTEKKFIELHDHDLKNRIEAVYTGSIYGDWSLRIKTFKDQESDPIDSILEGLNELRFGEKVIISHHIVPVNNYYNLLLMEQSEAEKRKLVISDGEEIGNESKYSVVTEKSRYSLFKYWVSVQIFSESNFRSAEIFELLQRKFKEFDQKDMCILHFEKPKLTLLKEYNPREVLLGYDFNRSITSKNSNLRQSIIGEIELFWLWHIPQTSSFKQISLDYINYRRLLPAREFKDNSGGYYVEFGESDYRNLEVKLGIKSWDDVRKHGVVCGGTGSGKSETLKSFLKPILDSDEKIGCVIIDPKSDLALDLLTLIPENRRKDIIYINPEIQQLSPVTFPFFDKDVANEDERVQREIEVIRAIARIDGEFAWGPQLEETLKGLFKTMNHLEYPLIDSVHSIANSISDYSSSFELFPDNIRKFWKDLAQAKIDKELTSRLSTPNNKLGKILGDEMIANIIDTNEGNFSMRNAIRSGKIVIVNLGMCSSLVKEVLGTYYTIRTLQIIYDNFKLESRSKILLLADEAQNIINYAPNLVAKMLSEVRGANCAIWFAFQYFSQIPVNVRESVWANCGTKIIMRTNSPEDSKVVSEFLGSNISQQDLLSLDTGHAYMSTLYNGKPISPVSMYVKQVKNDNKVRKEMETEISHETQRQFGVSKEDIQAKKQWNNKISIILKSLVKSGNHQNLEESSQAPINNLRAKSNL